MLKRGPAGASSGSFVSWLDAWPVIISSSLRSIRPRSRAPRNGEIPDLPLGTAAVITMSQLTQRSTVGDFVSGAGRTLQSVYLTAGSTASSCEIRDGTGPILLKLTASASGDGTYWAAADGKVGVQFSGAINLATIAGTGAAVTAEWS
jgi:hypothetical protein